MNTVTTTLDRWWAALYELLSSTHLQMFLLVGSGLLAIGFLVLALTRWGHSRPVWKCVILSVVAHILLMGYAYGTRLIMIPPSVDQEMSDSEPMRLNLVDETQVAESQETNSNANAPWNEFKNSQPMPKLDSLERPLIDSQIVIKSMERPDQVPDNSPFNVQNPSVSPLKPLVSSQDPQLDADSMPELSGIPDRFEMQDLSAQPIRMARMSRQDVRDLGPQFSDVPEDSINKTQETDGLDRYDLNQKDIVGERMKPSFSGEFLDPKSPLPLVKDQSSSMVTNAKAASSRARVSNVSTQLRVSKSPRRLADGKPLPRIYSLRNSANRMDVLRRRGGSIQTEQAVENGLLWLANHQETEGFWDPGKHGAGHENKVFGHNRDGAGGKADTGITGLATLAFLAGGHSHLEGPYQENVDSALRYLIDHQRDDGSLAGDAKLFARMYCHSMALLALSEALAMTGDERLLPVVQRGVDYSVRAQNRSDGGWRYQPGDEGDMSQFGWQVLALHSAEMGGAVVPKQATQRMNRFIESCASGASNGLASYRPGHAASTTMTAESLVCRVVLEQKIPEQTILEATRRIENELPSEYHVNLYYWYYGTLAMYFSGGSGWEKWNEAMKASLVSTQVGHGEQRGSWDPIGMWGGYGGRAYSTAMSALTLQVYYRYLPMYDRQGKNTGQFATQPVLRK